MRDEREQRCVKEGGHEPTSCGLRVRREGSTDVTVAPPFPGVAHFVMKFPGGAKEVSVNVQQVKGKTRQYLSYVRVKHRASRPSTRTAHRMPSRSHCRLTHCSRRRGRSLTHDVLAGMTAARWCRLSRSSAGDASPLGGTRRLRAG